VCLSEGCRRTENRPGLKLSARRAGSSAWLKCGRRVAASPSCNTRPDKVRPSANRQPTPDRETAARPKCHPTVAEGELKCGKTPALFGRFTSGRGAAPRAQLSSAGEGRRGAPAP